MIKSKIFAALLVIFCFAKAFSQDISTNNRHIFRYESENSDSLTTHLSIKPINLSKFFNFQDSLLTSENADTQSNPISKLTGTWRISKSENSKLLFNPIINSQIVFEPKSKKYFTDFGLGINTLGRYKKKLFWDLSAYGSIQKFDEGTTNFIDSFNIIPNQGKYSTKFKTNYISINYVGKLAYVPNKFFTFEIGKNTQFFGMGARSLFLSDNSGAKPYFSAEVNIWRLKYLWLTMKLSDFNITGTGLPEKMFDKYAFTHYFSFNLSKRINIDFFEAVISSPQTDYGNKGIDISYLNPIIFYRPVEFNVGSSDNALFGFGFNVRLFRSMYFYSQIMLDEFLFSELTARNAWWGNKQGYQIGAKWINAFTINKLLVGAEYNYVRPYTYTHHYRNINYGDMHQALAHPYGANFKESVLYFQKVFDHFAFNGRFIAVQKGLDTDSISYGQDIYKSYDLRKSDYDNLMLQGFVVKEFLFDFSASYFLSSSSQTEFFVGLQTRKSTFLSQFETHFALYFGLKSTIYHNKFIEKFD